MTDAVTFGCDYCGADGFESRDQLDEHTEREHMMPTKKEDDGAR